MPWISIAEGTTVEMKVMKLRAPEICKDGSKVAGG